MNSLEERIADAHGNPYEFVDKPDDSNAAVLDPITGRLVTDVFNSAINDSSYIPNFSPVWLKAAFKVSENTVDVRTSFSRFYVDRRLVVDLVGTGGKAGKKDSELKKKLCTDHGLVYVCFPPERNPTVGEIRDAVDKAIQYVKQNYQVKAPVIDVPTIGPDGAMRKVNIYGFETNFDGRMVGYNESGYALSSKEEAERIQERVFQEAVQTLQRNKKVGRRARASGRARTTSSKGCKGR